jgi:hypothetical protein
MRSSSPDSTAMSTIAASSIMAAWSRSPAPLPALFAGGGAASPVDLSSEGCAASGLGALTGVFRAGSRRPSAIRSRRAEAIVPSLMPVARAIWDFERVGFARMNSRACMSRAAPIESLLPAGGRRGASCIGPHFLVSGTLRPPAREFFGVVPGGPHARTRPLARTLHARTSHATLASCCPRPRAQCNASWWQSPGERPSEGSPPIIVPHSVPTVKPARSSSCQSYLSRSLYTEHGGAQATVSGRKSGHSAPPGVAFHPILALPRGFASLQHNDLAPGTVGALGRDRPSGDWRTRSRRATRGGHTAKSRRTSVHVTAQRPRQQDRIERTVDQRP